MTHGQGNTRTLPVLLAGTRRGHQRGGDVVRDAGAASAEDRTKRGPISLSDSFPRFTWKCVPRQQQGHSLSGFDAKYAMLNLHMALILSMPSHYYPGIGAISSGGEHCLHTAGVAGSNPASPTTYPTRCKAAIPCHLPFPRPSPRHPARTIITNTPPMSHGVLPS